ncbi:MAG: BatD family protein [Granulosicoccus sp.]|nr:BatD family protein [Granulosicoccus sp.]
MYRIANCSFFLFALYLLVHTSIAASATLEASIITDRDRAYPGEQILITFTISAPASAFSITHDPLTLKMDKGLSIQKNALQPLRQRKFQTRKDSLPWQHIETRYTLFAAEPGLITLNAVTIRATLPVTSNTDQQRNPKLSLTLPAQTINIQPIPDAKTTWLPAARVELESEWASLTDEAPVFTVGEPVNRRIRIIATDQQAAAIPPLQIPSAEGVRTYPGAAQLETSKRDNGLTGTRLEVLTLLPSEAGQLTLPAITVDWWDTRNRAWRHAELPAQTITVQAGNLLPTQRTDSGSFYRVVSLLLAGLCLVLLGCCIWLWKQLKLQRKHDVVQFIPNTVSSENKSWKRLRRAVSAGQLPEFRKALDAWLLLTPAGKLPIKGSASPKRLHRYNAAITMEPKLGEIINQWERSDYSADAQDKNLDAELPKLLKQALLQTLSSLRTRLRPTKKGIAANDQSTRQALYPTSRDVS